MQEKDRDEVSICPSFSIYSSGKIVEIAIKVVTGEISSTESQNESLNESTNDEFGDQFVDDGFEFDLVQAGDKISPIYPLFNRVILLSDDDYDVREIEAKFCDQSLIRASLSSLFDEDRDIPSSSSSEADGLETVPPHTYCVWSPMASPGRCKKSNSTGSSSKSTNRWRFRDLLRRSSSDGKNTIVSSTPLTPITAVKSKEVPVGKKVVSAHEEFYVRNRAMKESEKRKTYLPYKQEIVGLFANNVNSLSLTKSFSPF